MIKEIRKVKLAIHCLRIVLRVVGTEVIDSRERFGRSNNCATARWDDQMMMMRS